MCIIINNQKIDNERKLIINKIKKKITKIIDNPKLNIEEIKLIDKDKDSKNNTRIINIVQDGYLIAGTKQRVSKLFIRYLLDKLLKNNKDRKIDTLLYAGTMNGFGAIATAYSAYKLGLKSKVFLSGDILQSNTRQVNTLLALDSEITICKTYREARNLEWKTSNDPHKKWTSLPNYYVVPMGLNDEDGKMIELLSKQIKKASKGTILDSTIRIKEKNRINEKVRIWCVAGSGGIAGAIRKAFPDAEMFIYLVYDGGIYTKKVIEWAMKENITILNNSDKYKNVGNYNFNDRKKYYSSVREYDDLIWPYVKKYGKDGDFIWNVASDDLDIII
jgi:hypothetical protein